jgi:hypothetical protein
MWYGLWFESALDGLYDMISTLEFSGPTNNDSPLKVQYVLASVLFSKIVQDMKVNINMVAK